MDGVRLAGQPVPAHPEPTGETSRKRPDVLGYSLVCGAVATATGALVSLSVTGMTRVAVWCSVTAVTAVVSGMVHDSAPVNACWFSVRRSLRWESRP